jgi:hypothetical protein
MDTAWGTNDMALAAFLTLCGENCTSLYWFRSDIDPKQSTCFFLFEDTWHVRMLSAMFHKGDAQANVMAFTRQYARMKSRMMHSNKAPRNRRPSALAAAV